MNQSLLFDLDTLVLTLDVTGLRDGITWDSTDKFAGSLSDRDALSRLEYWVNEGARSSIALNAMMPINGRSTLNFNNIALSNLDALPSSSPVGIPITIICDNAGYQKCAIVFEVAEELGITFLYLPSYSPHLNLIERLWKFIRKECLYSKYYADFNSFRTAISSLIETAHIDKYKELKSLMSWKFQSFKKVKFLGV